MKRLGLFIIVMIVLMTQASAQDHMPLFTLLSDAPVVAHGSTEWEKNYNYTDPGAVIYHDGQFHMFRNAFRGWPAPVQIAYLTSPDAVQWTEMSNGPVLRTEEVSFAKKAALASSVLVEPDGNWVLYFYTWNTVTGRKGDGEIGRATASDPRGPWTVDPEPVLRPGSPGDWDEQMVNSPAVIRTDEGYVMYFTGYDQTGNRSGKIGRATSADGIAWTKMDDPATTDIPFAESDPIMTATEDWEGAFISQPRVEFTHDGWVMIYRAFGNPSGSMKIGIATSDDSLNWTKYAGNPVLAPTDVPEQIALWFTATAYNDDTYYLFTELAPRSGSNITDIFSLAYQGSLPPSD